MWKSGFEGIEQLMPWSDFIKELFRSYRCRKYKGGRTYEFTCIIKTQADE